MLRFPAPTSTVLHRGWVGKSARLLGFGVGPPTRFSRKGKPASQSRFKATETRLAVLARELLSVASEPLSGPLSSSRGVPALTGTPQRNLSTCAVNHKLLAVISVICQKPSVYFEPGTGVLELTSRRLRRAISSSCEWIVSFMALFSLITARWPSLRSSSARLSATSQRSTSGR